MKPDRQEEGASAYRSRRASEIDAYRDCTKVHSLPPIFHYWSNRYVRPTLEQHGFSDPEGMFLRALGDRCVKAGGAPQRFLSLGSGNCDLEIKVAAGLRAAGHRDFVIECLDLNDGMLRRGAACADEQGVAGNLEFVECDLNHWVAQRDCHAVIANQSLHHVAALESLFGQIRESLRPGGVFVVSDMIGRNGHLRWPEALAIVQEFWRKLPPSYRRNSRSGRYESVFEDSDCSTGSFEGIRAQDVVPLLLEYFHFQFFLGFGNVIDPFTDRSFGPNFDPSNAWDREFIDQVHKRDDEEIAAGRLQPTHMLAVLGTQEGVVSVFGASGPPRVRASAIEAAVANAAPPKSGYEWSSWPHSAQDQLEWACRAIEESETRARSLETRIRSLENNLNRLESEFQERTAWALQLDSKLRTAGLSGHDEETIARRLAWALGLDAEMAERTEWALRLDRELEQQMAQKSRLDRRLTVSMLETEALQEELREYLRHPSKFAARLLTDLASRLRKPRDSENALRTAP
jgi:SAM-dependent methyltransferase